jgi:maltooligosyltrehalose trehalohydrolase
VTRFAVWAPRADQVALHLEGPGEVHEAGGAGGGPVPMGRGDDGWWEVDLPDLPVAGVRYRYSLDGGEALPDPRSPWQPEGVHGPSETVDHTRFAWTDHGWQPPALATGVLYEAHVGTFSPGGTFRSMIGHLDHLVGLGVTHLELMPVAAFPGRWGWGYDGVDLYSPHPAYGAPDDLRALVDAGHARGLAVLLDVVYNHLGPEGNHLARFGPYLTDAYATPWGDAVNLDGPGSDEVRRFFVDNALMWLRDYHVDGLRLDAVHALLDRSATHLLEQLSTEVAELAAQLGRPLVLVAESDLNDPRLVRPPAAGGLGLDAAWSDDLHHALHVALTGERDGYYADYHGAVDLADGLAHGFTFRGQRSEHRGRRHGRDPVGLGGERFVVCSQNHDQVGNRARGERLGHLAGRGAQEAAAAVVLTSAFVPLLFQGEEWATDRPFPYFADHGDPQLVEAVRQGRLEEFSAFGWRREDLLDPEGPEAFEAARLDWSELDDPDHAATLAWYRALIALRASSDDLLDRDLAAVGADVVAGGAALLVTRGATLVVVALGDGAVDVELPTEGGRTLELALASVPGVVVEGGRLHLPGRGAVVLARGGHGGAATG